jgi:hypothetical protein
LYKKEIEQIQQLIAQYASDNIEFEIWVWIERKDFKKWRIRSEDIVELVAFKAHHD